MYIVYFLDFEFYSCIFWLNIQGIHNSSGEIKHIYLFITNFKCISLVLKSNKEVRLIQLLSDIIMFPFLVDLLNISILPPVWGPFCFI